MSLDRIAVFAAALDVFTKELDGVERMAALAADEVGNSESKSEGKYDTRSTEASYLARGQAQRVLALRRLTSWLQTVPVAPSRFGIGTLAQVDDDGTERWFLMLPDGGGVTVPVAGDEGLVVTPDSPVGRGLVGLDIDDEAEVDRPNSDEDRVLAVLAFA